MIRVGIEASRINLYHDLLKHPGRYFFILIRESRASLCIRTCDSQGENFRLHIIDGLSISEEGKLYSVFEDGINDTISKLHDPKTHSFDRGEVSLPSHLSNMISRMPDLVNWIVSSILSEDNNLVIYSMDFGGQ